MNEFEQSLRQSDSCYNMNWVLLVPFKLQTDHFGYCYFDKLQLFTVRNICVAENGWFTVTLEVKLN